MLSGNLYSGRVAEHDFGGALVEHDLAFDAHRVAYVHRIGRLRGSSGGPLLDVRGSRASMVLGRRGLRWRPSRAAANGLRFDPGAPVCYKTCGGSRPPKRPGWGDGSTIPVALPDRRGWWSMSGTQTLRSRVDDALAGLPEDAGEQKEWVANPRRLEDWMVDRLGLVLRAHSSFAGRAGRTSVRRPRTTRPRRG